MATSPLPSPAPLSRRDFLFRAAAGAAVASLAPSAWAASAPAAVRPVRAAAAFPIAALEKHFFEQYTPDQTGEVFGEMGLELELTVRPDGHIKPERAVDELPPMVAALARRQRRVLIVASSFVRPDEPHIASTLRTAKSLGIPYYRHRGFRYREGVPLKQQVASFRSMAREFAAMSREIGIQALYQNHAGASHAGAAIWDLDQILDDIDPRHFGVALDARHLMVELGRAWPTGIDLIAPRVGALFVKSFRWDRDRTIETPLADGIVTAEVINRIVGDRTALPVCLHVEHVKLQAVPFAQRAEIVRTFRDDAQVLRGWLGLA